MKKMYKVLFFPLLAATTLASCGGKGGNEVNVDSVAVDTMAAVVEVDEQLYGVPTPSEMFELLAGIEGNTVTDFNNPDNVKNYLTKEMKALNIGVFTSDFAFSLKVNKSQESQKFITSSIELLTSIGAEDAIDMEVINKMVSDFSTEDDAMMTAMDQTVAEMFSKLEANGNGSELALIMMGAWVEGVYLTAMLNDGYDAESPVTQVVSDQSMSLDQIVGFSGKYASEESVAAWLAKMNKIQEIYASMEVATSDTEVSQSKDGKFVFDGGDEFTLNEETYNQLITQIKQLRTEMIAG